ncbi:MAG: phosphodiesterase [Firmicutes bacterium ADurb.Bin080]|nr:metallophosphoesterase family protein [Clostridiales bacterium]OQC15087.1 MAG: phosphodiesterase [Firmicutes bacterium ADurb.Bin080]
MKIGIISDVHSNLEALNSALLELKDCDEIMCLGDVCHFGADTNACFDTLLNLKNFSMVKGNHDAYSNKLFLGNYEAKNELESYTEYMFNRTNSEYQAYIRNLPYVVSRNINGTRIAFTHFKWVTSNETAAVPDLPIKTQDLKNIFSEIEAEIVFFGHTHYSQDNKSHKNSDGGIIRYINFGPLGTPHVSPAMARCGALEINDKGDVRVEMKAITYDKSLAVSKISKLDHPFIPFILGKFFGN